METLDEALGAEGNSIFIATPSAKEPGKWQATEYWVEDGKLTPMGDSQYDSLNALKQHFAEDNYQQITDKDAVRRTFRNINREADTLRRAPSAPEVIEHRGGGAGPTRTRFTPRGPIITLGPKRAVRALYDAPTDVFKRTPGLEWFRDWLKDTPKGEHLERGRGDLTSSTANACSTPEASSPGAVTFSAITARRDRASRDRKRVCSVASKLQSSQLTFSD